MATIVSVGVECLFKWIPLSPLSLSLLSSLFSSLLFPSFLSVHPLAFESAQSDPLVRYHGYLHRLHPFWQQIIYKHHRDPWPWQAQ